MFGRSRKRKQQRQPEGRDADSPPVGPGPPAAGKAPNWPVAPEEHELDRHGLLEHWRQCEQRVTSAWKAWQAADRRDSGDHYDALMDALAEEERAAAEIERQAVGPRA